MISKNIFNTEKTKNIKEITIKPKKLVDKNWGVNTKTKSVILGKSTPQKKEDFLGETSIGF